MPCLMGRNKCVVIMLNVRRNSVSFKKREDSCETDMFFFSFTFESAFSDVKRSTTRS